MQHRSASFVMFRLLRVDVSATRATRSNASLRRRALRHCQAASCSLQCRRSRRDREELARRLLELAVRHSCQSTSLPARGTLQCLFELALLLLCCLSSICARPVARSTDALDAPVHTQMGEEQWDAKTA